jgi:Na+-translocating ferredoxin:NAD+ oxidoreductase subunit B
MCESEDMDHIVIPPANALRIVEEADRVFLRTCICRAGEQACLPDTWEVCLLFPHASKDDLRQARPITRDAALSILRKTADQRVLHLLFYTRNSYQVTELCSCCTCCCRPIRRIRREGNYAELVRSGYVAATDPTRCTGCGACETSCFFDARQVRNGVLHLNDDRCFGCGLCVKSCPEGAIALEFQVGRGVPIPVHAWDSGIHRIQEGEEEASSLERTSIIRLAAE